MAVLQSEYFSELMSQGYLAKVNLINIINSKALVLLTSCMTSDKLLNLFKSLFTHLYNEKKHKLVVWIK